MKTKPLTFLLSLRDIKMINKKQLIAGISLFIFILPQEIWADNILTFAPSPGVGWLQKEPASLYDVGMFRLEIYIKENRLFYIDPSAGVVEKPPGVIYGKREVHYKPLENKLTIMMVTVNSKNDLSDSFNEGLCKKIVEHFRRSVIFDVGAAGLDDSGKKTFSYGRAASRRAISSFFSHTNSVNMRRPKTLHDELVDITYVHVMQLSSNAKDMGYCEIPLAGGSISVTLNDLP
jgi:hypothetical protein